MNKNSGLLNIIESLCCYMCAINITGIGYKISVCHQIAPKCKVKTSKVQSVCNMEDMKKWAYPTSQSSISV